MELRCVSKRLHGIVEEDVIEVTCDSTWCGKRSGVTVLHRFNTRTGELLDTRLFAEPMKEVTRDNGTRNESNSIRSA